LQNVIIKTSDLTRRYKSSNGFFNAVDRLNLEVYAGEVFAFLGPNGAGKTTTMKMLLGLTFPTEGTFTILGGNIRDRKIRFRIGYLPEEAVNYPFLRVEDVLRFYARLFGHNREWRRKQVEEAIRFTGLEDKRHEQLKNLSKGLRQRVGIAQAIINDPELVFLDEPASGLDPIGIQDLRAMISRLKESGKTVFLNSHQLSEVELVANRVGMLRNGKLLRVGELESLLGGIGGVEIGISNISADKAANVIKSKLDLPDNVIRIRTDADGVIIELGTEDKTDDVITALISAKARIDTVNKRTKSLEELFSEVMREKE